MCSGLVLSEVLIVGIIYGYPHPVGTSSKSYDAHTPPLCIIQGHPVALSMPAPGVHICVQSDPQGGHWIAYYWVAVLPLLNESLSQGSCLEL